MGEQLPEFEDFLLTAAIDVPIINREGAQLLFRIANPKIIQACSLMREVLVEQHQEKEKVVSKLVKASNKKS